MIKLFSKIDYLLEQYYMLRQYSYYYMLFKEKIFTNEFCTVWALYCASFMLIIVNNIIVAKTV